MNFDLIIKKIMIHKGFEDEKEVAKLFGLSAPDLSQRKKRGSILPYVIDWAINEKVNLDWLIRETPVPSVSEPDIGYAADNDLREMLQRIIKEGDDTKLAAVRGVLAVYDPGKKK